MEFLYPNVFYFLLLPLVVLILLILTSKDNFHQHFSKEILEKLKVGGDSIGKTARNVLLFFSLIFFIVALARPVMDKKEQEVKQKLIPIVVALDLSKSMLASDIYPNRISLAKKKLKSIIKNGQNTTIGVVLFAKDSYILSPVTEDFLSLNYIVDNLDTDIDVANGSNIAAVLEATSHMLESYSVKNLIILSDGGNEDGYSDELDFAKENNIAIYSVGLATKNGSPIPKKEGGYMIDKDGKIVTVKLNDSIKKLSLQSGGGYIDFSLDDSDIKAIINRINIQSKKEELKSQKYKTYTELFYYPLGFGIFIFLLSTSSFPRRKTALKTILVLCSFSMVQNDLNAFEFEFETIEKAKSYYEKKEYEKAAGEYRKVSNSPQNYYNLANALYKSGKYQEAISTFEKIVTEDRELEYKKLHNMGNSFVKSNDLEKAKDFYEKALSLKEDKYTRENLELVKKELEKRENKQNNKDKNNKSQDQEDKSQDNKNQDKKNEQDKKEQNKEDKNKQQKGDKDKDQKNKNDQKNKKDENKEKKKQNEEKQDEKKQSGSPQKQNIKKQAISDMEEEKWMKMLSDKKTPIYLQKIETKKGNSNEDQPW